VTTEGHDELTAEAVMRLARARADELIRRVSSGISRETQVLLSHELEDLLRVFEDNLPSLQGSHDEEVISTSDAAKLLFVSHPHVVKLVEEGKLPLHHLTGQNRFLRKVDVLAYRAKKSLEARAFLETQTEDSGLPPGR
jgi:excisionase family DNA binding protein